MKLSPPTPTRTLTEAVAQIAVLHGVRGLGDFAASASEYVVDEDVGRMIAEVMLRWSSPDEVRAYFSGAHDKRLPRDAILAACDEADAAERIARQAEVRRVQAIAADLAQAMDQDPEHMTAIAAVLCPKE